MPSFDAVHNTGREAIHSLSHIYALRKHYPRFAQAIQGLSGQSMDVADPRFAPRQSMDGPDPRFAQNRYIPRRVGHCANQCGARSGSPQLYCIVIAVQKGITAVCCCVCEMVAFHRGICTFGASYYFIVQA